MKFPHYKQPDAKDCGPTCLKIIAKHYKKTIALQHLREISETQRAGSSLLGLSNAAEAVGFRSLGVKINLEKLHEVPLPSILHWNKNHYVVLYKIQSLSAFGISPKGREKSTFHISDPAHGILKYNQEDFLKNWIGNDATATTEEGIALLLEPTPKFYNSDFKEDDKTVGFSFLFKYIFKYKKFLWQLIFGLLAAVSFP